MKTYKTNCLSCWKEITVSFNPPVESVSCVEVVCCNNKQKRHKQVLVVDDDQRTLNIIERIYKYEQDYEINTTRKLDVALGFIKTSRIDLLIIDLMMPKRGSCSLIRKSRRLKPEIKIILTAKAGFAKKQGKLKTLGINQYLEKPFALKEFKSLVQKVLNN